MATMKYVVWCERSIFDSGPSSIFLLRNKAGLESHVLNKSFSHDCSWLWFWNELRRTDQKNDLHDAETFSISTQMPIKIKFFLFFAIHRRCPVHFPVNQSWSKLRELLHDRKSVTSKRMKIEEISNYQMVKFGPKTLVAVPNTSSASLRWKNKEQCEQCVAIAVHRCLFD